MISPTRRTVLGWVVAAVMSRALPSLPAPEVAVGPGGISVATLYMLDYDSEWIECQSLAPDNMVRDVLSLGADR